MTEHVTILPGQRYEYLYTYCDECDEGIMLSTTDPNGILIGDECVCGYYVTRYQIGMEPDAEPDEPYDEGYYYSGTGEWSEDDSYIDYLNRY